MRNFTIYLTLLVCLFASKMVGQETFESRARTLAAKIESITADEKAALKTEVEAVNNQLINGTITKDEADTRKKKLAEARAINIESRVAAVEEELKTLVQDKVDGKIKDDTIRRVKFTWNWDRKKDSIRNAGGQERTTSQFVFAMGANNLVTDGAVAGSDYRYWGSHFYEWGFTYNTRLAKNNNLLHLKYGLSLMYNNLRPTDNRIFVDNGEQTDLITNPVNMRDSRFRNVNLVLPVHLEFDFTKKKEHDGKPVFRTHESFRFGVGGYVGVNVKSKQILKYDIDGYKSREITKGSFNTNDFIYGCEHVYWLQRNEPLSQIRFESVVQRQRHQAKQYFARYSLGFELKFELVSNYFAKCFFREAFLFFRNQKIIRSNLKTLKPLYLCHFATFHK